MRIVRTMPDAGWVPVANTAAQDHMVSWRARGLLLELLSYPDGWETTVDKLVDQARRDGGDIEGQRAMRTAMAELARAGYVTYVRTSGKGGRWSTEIHVCDARPPATDVAVSDTSVTDVSVSRTSDNRRVGNRTGTRNMDDKTLTKTDIERSSKQHATSLASLAAAADAATDDERTIRAELEDLYGRVDRMSREDLRGALLVLENRRKKIYRECRNRAIAQIKREDPQRFGSPDGALAIDRLSFKYALMHYSPDYPVWMVRPLGVRT